jgi:hypothetical protein
VPATEVKEEPKTEAVSKQEAVEEVKIEEAIV